MATAFTYQGKLDRSGSAANSTCNFQFKLFDDLNVGNQIGSTVTVNSLAVTSGLFTVTLDFGVGAFDGQARWIEIAIQCTGDGGFTTLAPRQPLTAAPYALFALNNATGLTLPYTGSAFVNSDAAFSITKTGDNGAGILAQAFSSNGTGVVGKGFANGAYFEGTGSGGDGIEAVAGNGGKGVNAVAPGNGVGVYGLCNDGYGVEGVSTNGQGVYGTSRNSFGVRGVHGCPGICGGNTGVDAGVHGATWSLDPAGAGVRGENYSSGRGVEGSSVSGSGVYGSASAAGGSGVVGIGHDNGVYGDGASTGNGVKGSSNAANGSGVAGVSFASSGYGGYFVNYSGGYALVGAGKVAVHTLEIQGGDLVESFNTQEICDPGTVVVIDEAHPGRLRASSSPYDRKVAGVVSGAGGIAAGIYMGQDQKLSGTTPVAMTGRVYVKASAENGPIVPGDLLTTSATMGRAMKATDLARSGGTVIGKAMSALDAGTGLVLVLVNLQ